MISLGLVGAGEFGHFASSVLDRLAGVKLVAICDQNERAARAIATRYKVPTYRSYHDFLGQPLDMVAIFTPNDLHEPMVLQALQAGKHVFCEKPLALSERSVKLILKQAKQAKRLVAVDFVLRHNQFYQKIHQKISQFGPLRSMLVSNLASEATIKTPWYWDRQRSGGWFFTADIHFYDLFCWLSKAANPKQISATEYLSKHTGRTQAIATLVSASAGAQLAVYHRFNAKGKAIGATVLLDFEQAQIELQGWVPRAMAIATDGKIQRYRLDRDRETVYHAMVCRGLGQLSRAVKQGLPQQAVAEPEQLLISHRIAELATRQAVSVKLA